MTSADPFTSASPTFFYALRHRMKDGAPLQVMPHKRHGTLTGHIITVLIAGVVAAFVFWWGRL